jgi:hypothetical protein
VPFEHDVTLCASQSLGSARLLASATINAKADFGEGKGAYVEKQQ